MPKTKQTTKDKNRPESVQWLLEFANLGCKTGNVNTGKLFGGSSTLKRPPFEPGTPTIIHSSTGASGLITPSLFKEYNSIDNTKKKSSQEIFKLLSEYKKKKLGTPQCYSDINGTWIKSPDKEPILIGIKNDNPTLKEFRSFFSKTGVVDADDRMPIWYYTNMCLSLKIKNNFDNDDGAHHFMRVFFAEAFVTNRYDEKQIRLPVLGARYEDSLCNELKYSHENTLSQVACAYILDFWHNHRELHKYLRQCKCCGKFEIIQGGKWTYCGEECKRVFDYKSRKDDLISHASYREKLKVELIEDAHDEIIKCLRGQGCTLKVAENIYKKTPPKSRKSLKEFKRTSYSYKLNVKNSKNRSTYKG